MSKLKSLLVLVFMLLTVFIISVPVVAATDLPIPESKSHAVVHHERDILKSDINGHEIKTRDYLINEWHGEIRDLDNGQVELYGYTSCNRVCDEVSVQLVLQQWTGSTWRNLGSYTFVDYNADYAWGVKTVSVEQGKYYRTKSLHYAEDGSLIDQTSAITDAIFVE